MLALKTFASVLFAARVAPALPAGVCLPSPSIDGVRYRATSPFPRQRDPISDFFAVLRHFHRPPHSLLWSQCTTVVPLRSLHRLTVTRTTLIFQGATNLPFSGPRLLPQLA